MYQISPDQTCVCFRAFGLERGSIDSERSKSSEVQFGDQVLKLWTNLYTITVNPPFVMIVMFIFISFQMKLS